VHLGRNHGREVAFAIVWDRCDKEVSVCTWDAAADRCDIEAAACIGDAASGARLTYPVRRILGRGVKSVRGESVLHLVIRTTMRISMTCRLC
jgi:hypothetical protein